MITWDTSTSMRMMVKAAIQYAVHTGDSRLLRLLHDASEEAETFHFKEWMRLIGCNIPDNRGKQEAEP